MHRQRSHLRPVARRQPVGNEGTDAIISPQAVAVANR